MNIHRVKNAPVTVFVEGQAGFGGLGLGGEPG